MLAATEAEVYLYILRLAQKSVSMRRPWKIILPITLLAVAAGANAARPEDEQACRDVVVRLMTAADAGDAQTLRELIYFDRKITAQEQGVTAIIDCVVNQRALEAAMAKQWGADAAKSVADRMSFTDADRAAAQQAKVEMLVNRDALVILAANASPLLMRARDGRWRVVLPALRALYDTPDRSAEPGSFKRISHLRGVARVLRRVAARVRDGQYDSADTARAALQKELEGATNTGSFPTDYGNDAAKP
jgi:hypothetical protein